LLVLDPHELLLELGAGAVRVHLRDDVPQQNARVEVVVDRDVLRGEEDLLRVELPLLLPGGRALLLPVEPLEVLLELDERRLELEGLVELGAALVLAALALDEV